MSTESAGKIGEVTTHDIRDDLEFHPGSTGESRGAKLISRWHFGDVSGGVLVYESDNPQAGYDHAVEWSSMLTMTTRRVLADEQIGPILVKHFGG